MLACARIGAVHSVVFGGFAPAELAARIDDARPKVVVSASCGIEPSPGRRVQADARRGARAGPATSPSTASSSSASRHRGELAASATSTGRTLMQRRRHEPAECVDGRGDRPALHPLHLRHDRQAQGHRPRQRRPRGGAALVDAQHLRHRARARCGSPPATSAGSSATPTSSTRRCWPARRPCSTRASRSARPTPARSGGWSREHGVKALFTAPTAIRAIKKEDPDGALLAGYDLSVAAHAVPGRRAARPRHLRTGRPSGSACPVVDNWWQTETGWPIAANLRGLEPLPIKPGSPSVPVPGLRRAGPRRAGRAGGRRAGGRDLPAAAAAAGHAADAVGRRRALRRVATCRPSTATTSPATAATSTRTATCS